MPEATVRERRAPPYGNQQPVPSTHRSPLLPWDCVNRKAPMNGTTNGDAVATILLEKANAAQIQADLLEEEYTRLQAEADALYEAYRQRTERSSAKSD